MIELEVIMLKEKKIRFRPIWLISSLTQKLKLEDLKVER